MEVVEIKYLLAEYLSEIDEEMSGSRSCFKTSQTLICFPPSKELPLVRFHA